LKTLTPRADALLVEAGQLDLALDEVMALLRERNEIIYPGTKK
jgi:hypothetical protein